MNICVKPTTDRVAGNAVRVVLKTAAWRTQAINYPGIGKAAATEWGAHGAGRSNRGRIRVLCVMRRLSRAALPLVLPGTC